MKKIIAFGASNSSTSINQQLALWAAQQVNDADIKELNLNDFEAPIYSMDREKENGIPEIIDAFKTEINQADGIIISLAEHNGNFTAAFKNIYDWMTRIDRSVWNDLPMLLMSSSPGPGAGAGVLALATKGFAYAGGNITASFALPSFNQNFGEEGITNEELRQAFQIQLNQFQASLNNKKEPEMVG